MKKIRKLVLFCALLMVSTIVRAYDFSAVNDDGITIYYSTLYSMDLHTHKTEKYYGVTYKTSDYNSYSGIINIPASVTYEGETHPVKCINASAFRNCRDLTSVSIPNSVMSIGNSAFESCNSLTSITIPNSVTRIGDYAFAGAALKTITIPNSVTSIGANAFAKSLTLTSVIIPNSVTSIGDAAFQDCQNLTSISIPNSVTSIGNSVFDYCKSLTDITIPNSVTSIGFRAFGGCSGLSSVTIGNSVTNIGDLAFSNCSSLTSITIPNSVTSIGCRAFSGCSGLTSVTIGNSVSSIGDIAFESCSNVKELIYAEGTKTILCTDLTSITSVTIPTSATSIGGGAFRHCKNLISVTIPNSVTSIGDYAFYDCSSLTSVTIPNSVTSIGDYAFRNCTGLTSIEIPNSVTSVGFGTFDVCKSLTSVYVQWKDADKIPAIASNTFPYSTCDLYVPDGTMSIYQDKEYWNSFRNMIPNNEIWYTASSKLRETDYYLFSGLHTNAFNTSISSHTFANGKGLIKFDGIVTSIGSDAFYGCTGLTSINIPNSVTSIGEDAFCDCTGLASIDIPNSVTSIGEMAFYRCTDLTSINIPNSVESIGEDAFNSCSGLTSVTIPNSVTSIGEGAFWFCESLPVENNLRYADTYLVQAVDETLSTYTIKEGTRWIGSSAFAWCSGLTSITIPNSVESIGVYAFWGCNKLKSVTMKGKTPPKCESSDFYRSNVFWEVDISNATLTVPIGCILTYKKADVWKDFGIITDGEVQFSTIGATKKEATQTTITLMLDYDKEKCIPFEEIGVKWGNSYYKSNSEGIVKVDYCEPGKEITVYSYAKCGGEYYVSELGTSVRTKPINSELAFSDIMANKAFVRGVYDIGDAHVYKTTFELKIPTEYGPSWTEEEIEYKNDKFTLMGLDPDTEYGVCYTVYYHYGENDEYSGSEYDKQYFTTAKLKMKTLNPKNVSSTSSVVAAEANISDDETGVGFEWRKYDAPESLPSSKGGAIVYDGRMEGKINNLQPVYYNVRPYYESASGKMFYGDWITFDPTDFSYFEPTVHTYDFIDNPTTNSVEVRGYVMQGTDAVTEQGFEYWKTGKASKSKAAGNDVMRIQASGQMMIATLKDLDFESNYIVRAYVTTASGTIYGEERSFTTPKATPEKTLGDANMDGSINVSDITTIAKFILEGNVSPWSEVNADANEDGTINVSDITKTAEIILLRAKAEMEAAQSKK